LPDFSTEEAFSENRAYDENIALHNIYKAIKRTAHKNTEHCSSGDCRTMQQLYSKSEYTAHNAYIIHEERKPWKHLKTQP
jgi:hypothetical protein